MKTLIVALSLFVVIACGKGEQKEQPSYVPLAVACRAGDSSVCSGFDCWCLNNQTGEEYFE